MYLVRESAAVPLYLQPFSSEVAAEVGTLIARIRPHKAFLMEHWQALCATGAAAHGVSCEQLLEETYFPRLRSGIECLARGDVAGFMRVGRILGAELAAAGLPFAAIIAHASVLKDGCAKALADDSAGVGEALLALERPMSCLVTALAEGYYGSAPATRADDPSDDVAPPLAAAPDCGPAGSIFHGMVGRSEAMQRVFAQIRRMAASTAPILILGDTGTGKELAARAIHAAGPRHNRPFVALNCAALPRELVESELFGHKRGAFSGAVADCLGLIRAADGGTLLLDEITEMAPELQAKLLRVLQERAVRPVGSVIEEPVDVRIIASTNRDPETALRSGMLRPDLYYRLRVSMLALPPLCARREDIPALVEYHLAVLSQRAGADALGVRGVTPSAMRVLIDLAWPGNVRELLNVVENAFTMCSAVIGTDDLDVLPERSGLDPVDPTRRLSTFQEHERNLIERTLELTQGNKLRAARELGISRKMLYARMARYGLAVLLLHAIALC